MDKVKCPQCGLLDDTCTPCGEGCYYDRSAEDCKQRYKIMLPPGEWNVFRAPVEVKKECISCGGPLSPDWTCPKYLAELYERFPKQKKSILVWYDSQILIDWIDRHAHWLILLCGIVIGGGIMWIIDHVQ